MSVHQLRDGRWIVRYPRGRNPDDPGRTREYFGRGPDGERQARERNHEMGLGRKVQDRSPYFIDLAHEYLAAKAPAMAEASSIALKAKLSGVILPRLGKYRASQITPELLDRYVADRLKTVKRTTVHRDLSDIRAILRWSVKRRYIPANPMDGFELPKRDDAIIQPPTVAEIQAIMDNASPHLYRAILLSYYTGLRPGEVELLRLTWEQVDMVGNTIVIKSAEKNGLKKREVPIFDQVFADLLAKWYAEDIKNGLTAADPVITYHGRPIQSLKTAWKAAKKRAKITRRLRMYDLRHSFATKMLDNGADLKHVSTLLGHKSVQQTVDTYQHLSSKLTREALEKLPSIFDEK